ADQRRPIRVARAYVLDDVVEQDRDRMQAHSANTRGSLKTTSSLVTRTSSTRASNRELIAAISASTKSSGALAPAVTPTLRTPSNQAQSTSSAEPTSRASRAPARLATSTKRTEFELFGDPITSTRSACSAIAFTASWRLVVA